MRFDPDRVTTLADAWNDPRLSLSPAEAGPRAADAIAGLFEAAGLSVERTEAPATGSFPWRMALILAVWLGLTTGFLLIGLSIPARIGLIGVIVASLLATARWVGRRTRAAASRRAAPQILGRPVRDDRPTARIVLLTQLGGSSGTVRGRWMVFLWGLLVFQGLNLLLLWAKAPGEIIDSGLNLLFGQWLTAFWIVLSPAWRRDRPIPGQNRTGPALLAELARTWPQRLGERVETWFVATPHVPRFAVELARRPGETPPTLIIDLDAPGVGDQLLIGGRGPALAMADTAARDLWIPHRTTRKGIGLFLSIFSEFGWLVVVLRGAPADAPVNPALLAGTAQLATEIALRWARQSIPAGQPESPARSSQNPG